MPQAAAFSGLVDDTLADQLGSKARVVETRSLGGNQRQTHWRLALGDGSHLFAKVVALADAPIGVDMFAAEADGLDALRRGEAFAVPRVVARGQDTAHAVLLLEYMELRRPDSRTGAALGEALAQLHSVRGEHFGWPRDNYLGVSPQANSTQPYWPIFFSQNRLAPQFAMAAANGYRGQLQEHGERIRDKIGAFFLDYRSQASLVHGDLWSGNVGVLDSGMPAIFDPAVHFADREVDVAMSELFGGFPDSFYLAYRKAAPLDTGYELRKPLYNLYHILNHLNLFGAGYLGQAERMARNLFNHLRN